MLLALTFYFGSLVLKAPDIQSALYFFPWRLYRGFTPRDTHALLVGDEV